MVVVGLRMNTIASSPMKVSGGGLNYKPPPLQPVNLRFNSNSNRRLSPPSDTAAVAVVLSSTVGGGGGAAIFTHQHIKILSLTACAAAVSTTWLFCSAIPALMAFKKAAESMEKLIDLTTAELPVTMASIRLSGAEISDLTMELSDVGQELTRGVRNSTRFVRVVEENLTKLTTSMKNPSMEVKAKPKNGTKEEPDLARTARGIRQGIVKTRGILQTLFTFFRFSKIVLNFLRTRALSKTKGLGA